MYTNTSTHKWLTDEQRSMRAKQEDRCPLCGARVVYRGFSSVECAVVSDCPNYRAQPAPDAPRQFTYLQTIELLSQGFRMRFRMRDLDTYGVMWFDLEPKDIDKYRGMNAEAVDQLHVFEQADA